MTIQRSLAPHRIEAYNTAIASENKIHDDSVARRLGFAGGLVPGVDVYAYMTHLPVARWGCAWLERGLSECRFIKPVYDGHVAVATAAPADDGLELALESDGALCATGNASMAARDSALSAGPLEPVPPRQIRPAASEQSLAPETQLGIHPFALAAEYHRQYLRDVRETHSLYAERGICHPGLILRLCNWALMHNVTLGPWIHVGSKVRNLGLARVGDVLTVRAVVAANYERKGHRMVDLDVLVLANNRVPLAQIAHTAIYRPREVSDHTI